MIVRTVSYVLSAVAYFFGYYNCHAAQSKYHKDRGIRPKLGLFATADIFFNDSKSRGMNDFLVNTPGCYIPDYSKNYKYVYNMYKGFTPNNDPCGVKAISLYNIGNNRITFGVNETAMRTYSNSSKFSCCYMYAYKTASFPGLGTKTKLFYTKCVPFRNGTMAVLQYEVLRISCINQMQREIYNDAFISVRKLAVHKGPMNNTAWNVLLIGIDGMSRARLFGTMPETYKYLKGHKWLDYRGYTKIDSNTFPNLMAVLTGMNYSRIHDKCQAGLHKCEGDFIWAKYNASGYRTAYGEDYLELPDTFSRYKGFRKKPTDHYMRPFYLIGEKREWDVLCTRMKPSATHLLGYAYNFANSYKHNHFFGLFWINSYSHGATDNPSKFDNEMTNWLQKLQKENILKRTFVIFFSDHGLRYGEMKLPIESYYDDRLPMLYVWAPPTFQKRYPQRYTNMLLNQHRLVSPFDLYATLGDILKLSDRSSPNIISEACAQCTGLFTLNSLFRTCSDARINQNWCVCHTMAAVKNNAAETNHSLQIAMTYINNIVQNIKTMTCYDCRPLTLHSVIRSHAFQSGSKTYNVVAFQTSHDVKFEATIAYRRETSKVTYLRSLTSNSKRGKCVRDINDRPYCHCLMRCNTLIL